MAAILLSSASEQTHCALVMDLYLGSYRSMALVVGDFK